MPSFQDFYFESSTGRQIHARKCLPDGQPRAVIQIAHGIAEYIERYDEFMQFLAEAGFVVAGNDHRGHGKSISAPEDLGFFAEQDGWSYVVGDMDRLRDVMHSEYPELPYIFFGHSMGSFLTRTYIIEHPSKYDAVILSGTGQQSAALVASGYAMASILTKKDGPRGSGEAMNNIAFGSYNKRFEPKRTNFDWLSKDEAMVDKYIADPLCGFAAKVSLYRDMMGGIRFISKQANVDRMSKRQPVYFMSGADDPVGDYGVGVEKAYKAFCKAGLKDVYMKLYPAGRHEMLNETNRLEVYKDVLDWINSKMDKI